MQQHPGLQRVQEFERSRGCWQRVKDYKTWWATLVFGFVVLILVLAALTGVIGRSQECLRTDNAGPIALVLFVIALVFFVIFSGFACCVTSTEEEFETEKYKAGPQRAVEFKRSRGCVQRFKDYKTWWSKRFFGFFLLFLVLAAITGVAGRNQECIKTDKAGPAALILFVVAAVLLFFLSLFLCCVPSTEEEFETEKYKAMSGTGNTDAAATTPRYSSSNHGSGSAARV